MCGPGHGYFWATPPHPLLLLIEPPNGGNQNPAAVWPLSESPQQVRYCGIVPSRWSPVLAAGVLGGGFGGRTRAPEGPSTGERDSASSRLDTVLRLS